LNANEPEDKAPSDIYDYDRSKKNPSRMQASVVATVGFMIFGGLVGGGAFAMNGGLQGFVPGTQNAPASSNFAPSASPKPTTGAGAPARHVDLNGNLQVTSETNQTDTSGSAVIADNPVASSSAVETDPVAEPSDSVAPSESSSSGSNGNQIIVPPVFNHGGGESVDNNGSGNEDGSGHHRKNPSARPTHSPAPHFGSGGNGSGGNGSGGDGSGGNGSGENDPSGN
jgi:hypothetical protein